MEQAKIHRLIHICNEIAISEVLYHSGIQVAGGFTFNWLPDVKTRNQRRIVKNMLERINPDPNAWVVNRTNLFGTQSIWYADQADGAMLMLNLQAITNS